MRRLAFYLLAIVGTACGAADPVDPGTPLRMAASIPPHAWLVQQIGGDAVTVTAVLRPGESPATHQPSDAQVSRILTSRIFFAAGVPFESGSWFDALGGQIEIVGLDDGVADLVMDDHRHRQGGPSRGHEDPRSVLDPHAWLSPKRLALQARMVTEALKRLDPSRAKDFDLTLGELLSELDELDRRIKATLAPYRGRAFVVFHPSWGYFADDYGLTQIAIEIEGKEPTDAEITRLQRQVQALDISVVFVQPQIAGRAARAVADAMGAELETLDPLAAEIPVNLERAAKAIAGSFHG